jgi:hypothetical protein
MKAMVTKYGKVAERIGTRMTRAQALKLKALAEEAYQPEQYAANLPSGKPSAGSTRSGRKSLWRIRSEFVATMA